MNIAVTRTGSSMPDYSQLYINKLNIQSDSDSISNCPKLDKLLVEVYEKLERQNHPETQTVLHACKWDQNPGSRFSIFVE